MSQGRAHTIGAGRIDPQEEGHLTAKRRLRGFATVVELELDPPVVVLVPPAGASRRHLTEDYLSSCQVIPFRRKLEHGAEPRVKERDVGWDIDPKFIIEGPASILAELPAHIWGADAHRYNGSPRDVRCQVKPTGDGLWALFYDYERRKYVPFWIFDAIVEAHPELRITALGTDVAFGLPPVVYRIRGPDHFAWHCTDIGPRGDLIREVHDPELLFRWFRWGGPEAQIPGRRGTFEEVDGVHEGDFVLPDPSADARVLALLEEPRGQGGWSAISAGPGDGLQPWPPKSPRATAGR